MKQILIAALLASLSGAVHADYQDEIDAFFTLFAQAKVSEAVDRIYATNKYVSEIPDQLESIKTQLSSVENLMGRYYNAVKIDEYMVKGSFVQVTYMVVFDRQPLRFEFQFFKAGDDWKIYRFSFNDDLDEEIQQAARKRAVAAD